MDRQQTHKAFFKMIIKESLREILKEEGILAQLKNLKQGEVSSKELTTERKVPVTRPAKVDVVKENFFDDLDFNPLKAIRQAAELKNQNPEAARILAESIQSELKSDDEGEEGVDLSVIKRLLTKNN